MQPQRGTTLYAISMKMHGTYRKLIQATENDDVDAYMQLEYKFFDLQEQAMNDDNWNDCLSELNQQTAKQRIREAEQHVRSKPSNMSQSLAQLPITTPVPELREDRVWTSIKCNDRAFRGLCLARRANFVVIGAKCMNCERGSGPYDHCAVVIMRDGKLHPGTLDRCTNCVHASRTDCNITRLPALRQAMEDKRREKGDLGTPGGNTRRNLVSTGSKQGPAKRRNEASASGAARKISGHSQTQTRLRFQVTRNLTDLENLFQK